MNNWMIALPEIVLAVTGLAILIIGVLRKQDAVLVCTMLAIGGLVLGVIPWWLWARNADQTAITVPCAEI